MRFQARIEQHGKTATGVAVPEDVLAELGGKRVPVRVVINGYSYRTTIGSMAGRSMIPLAAEHRKAAGVAAGAVVEIGVERDDAVRTTELPDDLAAALAAEPGAQAFFAGLATSYQKEYVRWLTEPKKPETRQARLDKTVQLLLAGKNRH